MKLKINYYGKPTRNTYDYTRKQFLINIQLIIYKLNLIRNQEIYICIDVISLFLRIGDNPKSDIRGGNQAGWKTILVRSGVFTGEKNDHQDPGTYVVDNMKQAFELICEKERIIDII